MTDRRAEEAKAGCHRGIVTEYRAISQLQVERSFAGADRGV